MKSLKGQNSLDLQKANRSLVIRTLNKQRTTTRAEICALTGLNKATVTNIVNDLIAWGAVREVGMSTGKSGRRTILIEIARENYAIIGAWLKRNEFITGIFDIYGECQFMESVSFSVDDIDENVVEIMTSQLNRLIEKVTNQKLLGVAIALPGPYIKKKGKIALITGRWKWIKEDIEKKVKSSLCADVYTQHDCNAATMAEWYYTCHGDETANMMCVMVGHGVGSGMIENGKIVNGSLGTAGEIGHTSIRYDGRKCECGNFGCLETYCTMEAVMAELKQLLPQYPDSLCDEKSTFHDVMVSYQKKDPLAQKVINQVAEYLGYGIINAINLLNPKQIIIGDELPEAAGKQFLDIVKKTVKERILPEIYNEMEIELSGLENPVLKGACICLLEELFDDPEKFKCR